MKRTKTSVVSILGVLCLFTGIAAWLSAASALDNAGASCRQASGDEHRWLFECKPQSSARVVQRRLFHLHGGVAAREEIWAISFKAGSTARGCSLSMTVVDPTNSIPTSKAVSAGGRTRVFPPRRRSSSWVGWGRTSAQSQTVPHTVPGIGTIHAVSMAWPSSARRCFPHQQTERSPRRLRPALRLRLSRRCRSRRRRPPRTARLSPPAIIIGRCF